LSACGNDFLIVEGIYAGDDIAALSRRLCDRHNGIGADGIEWLYPDTQADIKVCLLNADGSEAEISGNGTRCVAAEILSRETEDKKEITIRTGAGVKTCRLTHRAGFNFEFETSMGQPEDIGKLTIESGGLHITGTQVSLGNPHFVVLVEKFPDKWQEQAALIAAQPPFPHGTNVEFVIVRSAHEIEMRIFERGAGETQSSGTGSCASAVAAIASGHVTSPVNVIAPGGTQTVTWQNEIHLRGTASLICRGEYFV
jgi:diaminopimelate epimerase